jgi:hypothetical protein
MSGLEASWERQFPVFSWNLLPRAFRGSTFGEIPASVSDFRRILAGSEEDHATPQPRSRFSTVLKPKWRTSMTPG